MGHKNYKKCFVVDTEIAFIDTWLLQPETMIFNLYKKLIELGAPSESLVVSGLSQFLFRNTSASWVTHHTEFQSNLITFTFHSIMKSSLCHM